MSTFTALTSVAGFVEPVTDGWILGIRWISRGNVAGCKIILAAGIPGFLAAVLLAPKINVISLGDDMATGLGIHPQRVRFITIL